MIIIDTINQTVTIDRLCIVTKKEHSVTVPLKGYNRWIKGEYIHTAMPEVSAEDREFLISSTSPEGWNILFPPEDEDSDDEC